MKEINSVIANELAKERNQLLPLMVGDDGQAKRILKKNPLLADRNYLTWDGDVDRVVEKAQTLIPRPQSQDA